MFDTYICYREPANTALWGVFKVQGDGSRQEMGRYERYLDAARVVRELRSDSEDRS